MPKAKEAKTYEDRIGRLEELIALLEKGELPLEKAIDCYKEAMGLAAECDKQLQTYRQELVKISEGEETPFTAESE